MSFWNLLSEFVLFKWLFRTNKPDRASTPPSCRLHDHGNMNNGLHHIQSSEDRIYKLRQQQDRYDILSEKYDELEDRIDDLQDEQDEMEDYSDDDF